MIVADSDILIDALRGREPSTSRVRLEIEREQLATTVITLFEVLSGARDARTRDQAEALLRELPVWPLDAMAAVDAVELRQELERGGTGIGVPDYLIAGICRSQGAALLTRNVAHFGRVPGLEVQSP